MFNLERFFSLHFSFIYVLPSALVLLFLLFLPPRPPFQSTLSVVRFYLLDFFHLQRVFPFSVSFTLGTSV